MFTQTQFFRILSAWNLACSFFSDSLPRDSPQKPSLLLGACLHSARAPTDSSGGFIFLFVVGCSYTSITVFNLLNPSISSDAEGQGYSKLPGVFLIPSIVYMPLGPSVKINSKTF